MNKPVITKEKFGEYRVWQGIGYYNMLNYDSWKEHTTLTREEWLEIINNYSKYLEMYE